jgi:protein NrfD
VLLIGSAACQFWLLAGFARSLDPAQWGWIFAGSLLGSLLFGSVLLTMNLGHWYLVSRSLPLSLLFRAASGYAAACAARAGFLVVVAMRPTRRAGWEALTSLDREGLFFLFRVLWGIVGPLALSYFIFQTSKMRSNQAATGLLYVALLFVLIGELLSAYLTVLTGFPA